MEDQSPPPPACLRYRNVTETLPKGIAGCRGDKLRPLLGGEAVLAAVHGVLQPLRAAAPALQRHEHVEHPPRRVHARIVPIAIPGELQVFINLWLGVGMSAMLQSCNVINPSREHLHHFYWLMKWRRGGRVKTDLLPSVALASPGTNQERRRGPRRASPPTLKIKCKLHQGCMY